MPTHDEKKGADEELFHSLAPEPNSDKSANYQLIIILVGVALVVVAGLVWFEFQPKPTPFDSAVKGLHADMERLDVVSAVGHETRVDSWPSGLDAKCTSAYKVEGVNQPLFISYKPVKADDPCPHYSDKAVQWCAFIADETGGAVAEPGQPKDASGHPMKLVCHVLK
jgi:hypothetical protein